MSEAHIRIDEGVKRGPRKKPAKVFGIDTLPAKLQSATLRPMRHIPDDERAKIAAETFDRYINGEQVAAIAPDYNVSDVTMYALLLGQHEQPWKEIQTARALARLERAQELLAIAADALSLARARELVRSAQWELERLFNRIYGAKQELTVVTVDLGDKLRRAKERVIEGEVVQVIPQSNNP